MLTTERYTMHSVVELAIQALITKIGTSTSAEDALKFSQAALNLARVVETGSGQHPSTTPPQVAE